MAAKSTDKKRRAWGIQFGGVILRSAVSIDEVLMLDGDINAHSSIESHFEIECVIWSRVKKGKEIMKSLLMHLMGGWNKICGAFNRMDLPGSYGKTRMKRKSSPLTGEQNPMDLSWTVR